MSKKGDRIECTIWSGPQPGIYIGFTNRDRHFSQEFEEIEIEIDGKLCKVNLPPSFWVSCPEIRVARDEKGKNVLLEWIRKNNLMPPTKSRKIKGKEDRVILEVIEPYRKFKLRLK